MESSLLLPIILMRLLIMDFIDFFRSNLIVYLLISASSNSFSLRGLPLRACLTLKMARLRSKLSLGKLNSAFWVTYSSSELMGDLTMASWYSSLIYSLMNLMRTLSFSSLLKFNCYLSSSWPIIR